MRNGTIAIMVVLLILADVASFAVAWGAYKRTAEAAKKAGFSTETFREVYGWAVATRPDAPDTQRISRGIAGFAASTLTLMVLGLFLGRR